MNAQPETVKVKSWVKGDEDGFIVINKADFDKEKHELFDEKKSKPSGKADDGNNEPVAEGFDAMTVKELRAYAKENKVDITGLKSKDELVKAMNDAENDVAEPNFASDEAGEKYAKLVEAKQFEPDAWRSIDGSGQDGAIEVGDIDDYVDSLAGE